MNRIKIEAIGIIIGFLAIILALFTWLIPFNPVGTSPVLTVLKLGDETPTNEPTLDITQTLFDQNATNEPTLENNQEIIPCQILLYSESFDQDSEYKFLFDSNGGFVKNGKMRFIIKDADNGEAYKVYGQYEQFSLEFEAYPVGDIFDASINVLFLRHKGGHYEYQVRPRMKQFQFFRKAIINGETDLSGSMGWTTNEHIFLGKKSTLIQLVAKHGEYEL